MLKFSFLSILHLAMAVLCGGLAHASAWDGPVRSSWVCSEFIAEGDVILAEFGRGCEIVVSNDEHSAVRQAARFLADDVEKLGGYRPPLVTEPSGYGKTTIHLVTLGQGDVPRGIRDEELRGHPESFQIVTRGNDAVWLVGADFRGTAYAAYTLSERLGIDPLYHWTGYRPTTYRPLAVQRTDMLVRSPAFRYRGFLHAGQDILPRPRDPLTGYPLPGGRVPREWYERYFETALRLRMNIVAPWVEATREPEVARLAGEWGLILTSTGSDILLSNPRGYQSLGLARRRSVEGPYDWTENRDGLLHYWSAGVLENRWVDALWPVGLASAGLFGATPGAHEAEVESAVAAQIELAERLLPPEREKLFLLTLDEAMADRHRIGLLNVPDNVILLWEDSGDGVMPALPSATGHWRHGVVYHLASASRRLKQTVHVAPPSRVAEQLRLIVAAGATELLLVDVSEMRDYVMEARMLADLSWDTRPLAGNRDAAAEFTAWWCKEYFGETSAPEAVEVYAAYHRLLNRYSDSWYGAARLQDAVLELVHRDTGQPGAISIAEVRQKLEVRAEEYRRATELADHAAETMDPAQRRFFFEHAVVGLLVDYRPTQSALLALSALETQDGARRRQLLEAAGVPLEKLDMELRRAERAPFEGWYGATWLRPSDLTRPESFAWPRRSQALLRNTLRTRPGKE